MNILNKLWILLINIDQETVLYWFGVDSSTPKNSFSQQLKTNSVNGLIIEIEPSTSTPVSVGTLKLILEGLWQHVQNGLTIDDLKTFLFFAVFLRLVFLAIRYNIKTSFIVTCIGLVAGYLWFNHFIELLKTYQIFLGKIPPSKLRRFVDSFPDNWTSDPTKNMGVSMNRSIDIDMYSDAYPYTSTDSETGMGIVEADSTAIDRDWTKPSSPYFFYYAKYLSQLSVKQLISTTFDNAIVKTDLKTEIKHYIDPVSLITSKIITQLDEPKQKQIMSFYYTIYDEVIPNLFKLCKFVWYQFAGVIAYILITRLGKKFCPYLIRWHWTFLLLLTMIERPITIFLYRAYFYTNFHLAKEIKITEQIYQQIKPEDSSDPLAESLVKSLSWLQIKSNLINDVVMFTFTVHLILVFLGFLHALFGQYFYVPFLVPNTELHVGLRPENSLYSQGNTSWQDSKKTDKVWRLFESMKKLFKKIFRKLFPRFS